MKEIQTEIQYDSPYLPILLRQAREAKGWSQESVAHGLCAVFYLSKIENGRIVPAPDLAYALVRRLDLMLVVYELLLVRNRRVIEPIFLSGSNGK